MAKLLVVGRSLISQTVARIFQDDFEGVVESDHESALEKFLAEEPTHVIIFDYDEHGDGTAEFNRGLVPWRDIKNSAESSQVIVRSGFSRYDYPDYIQLPFKLEDVRKMLGI
jgi:hypothetical protein